MATTNEQGCIFLEEQLEKAFRSSDSLPLIRRVFAILVYSI